MTRGGLLIALLCVLRGVTFVSFQGSNLGLRRTQAVRAGGVAMSAEEEFDKRAEMKRIRDLRLSSSRGRYTWIHGGETPKPHPWLEEGFVPRDKDSRVKKPDWLTLEKWQTWSSPTKCRSLRWYLRAFDDKGTYVGSRKKEHSVPEAIDTIIKMYERMPANVDPSLEFISRFNLDAKYPNQQIRTALSLPHGTGKNVRVAVFCTPDEEAEVLALGAFKAGKTLSDEIEAGNTNFDVLIAKSAMMPRLAKLGKILGPKKLMPSPKSGTVVTDFAEGINNFKGGTLQFRSDSYSRINCAFGKVSLGREKLVDNFRAILKGLAENAPEGAKRESPEAYWKNVKVGSSHGPSLRILPTELPAPSALKQA